MISPDVRLMKASPSCTARSRTSSLSAGQACIKHAAHKLIVKHTNDHLGAATADARVVKNIVESDQSRAVKTSSTRLRTLSRVPRHCQRPCSPDVSTTHGRSTRASRYSAAMATAASRSSSSFR